MRLHLPKIGKEEGAQIMQALKESGFVELTERIKEEQRALVARCKCEVSQACFMREPTCRYYNKHTCRLKRYYDLNML